MDITESIHAHMRLCPDFTAGPRRPLARLERPEQKATGTDP
jgi:hypothetical protein